MAVTIMTTSSMWESFASSAIPSFQKMIDVFLEGNITRAQKARVERFLDVLNTVAEREEPEIPAKWVSKRKKELLVSSDVHLG